MRDPIALVDGDLPKTLDISVRRGTGGDAAAIAIQLPAALAPGEVVRFEVRHGFKIILSRRTDDSGLRLDADNSVVTWWPLPEETCAIRSGRVDKYSFELFRPGAALGVLVSGFLIGADA